MRKPDLHGEWQHEVPADPFATCMGDLAWNTMFLVLVVSVSLVVPTQVAFQDLDLQMAKASRSAPIDNEQAMIRVTIDHQGMVALEQTALGPLDQATVGLPAALNQLADQYGDRPYRVYVVPDRQTPYEAIVAVHDAICLAVASEKVSLVAEEMKGP